MNIFEGSRRTAYLLAGLSAATTVFFAVKYDPYVSLAYSISHPRAEFQRMTESCPIEAGRAYFIKTSQSGDEVSINLCLLTTGFGERKRQLIPYKVDEKNMVWGGESFSDEVSAYGKELEARFTLSANDNTWLVEEKSRRYWNNWKDSLANLAIGLAVFAGVVWAIGWIVRGFMGIPRGMDRKPESRA